MTPEPIVIASAHRPGATLRFFISLLLVFLAYAIVGVFAGLFGRSAYVPPLYSVFFLVLLLCGFLVLLYSLDQVRSSLWAAAGLPRREALPDALVGIAIGIGAVSVCVLAIALIGRVDFQYRGAHPLWLVLTLTMLIAAAMSEELIFRGYPFHRLMEAVGSPAAVAIMSGIFGLAHLRNPNASLLGAVNTAEVGVLLALAYLRTRSLWLPFGIHFGWNTALGVGYGLTVSGYSNFSVVVKGADSGPRWLTGGEYGIEASGTVTLVILLMILVVIVLIRQRPAPDVIVSSRPEPPHMFPESHQASDTRIQ